MHIVYPESLAFMRVTGVLQGRLTTAEQVLTDPSVLPDDVIRIPRAVSDITIGVAERASNETIAPNNIIVRPRAVS